MLSDTLTPNARFSVTPNATLSAKSLDTQRILIHSAHHETRVAVLDNGILQELHIERNHQTKKQAAVVGNVYLGKVMRVLPGMQSAFVEVGLDKTAFLHVADLLEVMQERLTKKVDAGENGHVEQSLPIEKRLFVGQTLLVQVLKEPLGTKGARLTTQISLAGRYLVLLPQDNHIGISQKITDPDAKQAVRERLQLALPAEFSLGIIARTQAQDASVAQLSDDIHYLMQVWQGIVQQTKTQGAPAILHRDLSLSERALRDLCGENTQEIVVDGAACYAQLHSFAASHMPAILPKLTLHLADYGVFDLAKVDTQLLGALNRRVNLNSGAYLVIDQTESMCTIDVNTGSFVGGKQFADTVLHTNLEAAKEIARQLRLRNLGGIILIDFIDMVRSDDREKVNDELTKYLSKDPVHTRIYGFTALGLMELSRKRVRESLAHVLLQPCSCCEQTAQVKTPQTIAYEILREIELQTRQFSGSAFTVKAASLVVAWFEEHPNYLLELSEAIGRSINVSAFSNVPDHTLNNTINDAFTMASSMSACDKKAARFELLLT
jgi:ribonuclease G